MPKKAAPPSAITKKKVAYKKPWIPESEFRGKAPMPHFTEFEELVEGNLMSMAEDLAELNRKKAALDLLINEHKSIIRAVVEQLPITRTQSFSVRIDDSMYVSYVRPKDRETLVPELLIQAGVTEKQLKKGTKKTPVEPFVTVRVKKSKEEEGED